MECWCLIAIAFELGKMKNLWRWMVVKVPNNTGLNSDEDGKFYVMCALPQLKISYNLKVNEAIKEKPNYITQVNSGV